MSESTDQHLFAEFLVEGVWKEVREARQNLNAIQRQVSEVTQQQQQGPHGCVHDRHLDLEPGDELKHHQNSNCTVPQYNTHTHTHTHTPV